jgi:uncharacterized protein (DUF58 family)
MKWFKTALSVLAVVFLLYIFTFYVDGEMGMILLAFLVLSPLVSLLLVLWSRDRVKLSFRCDAYVNKGSDLKVTVTVEKSGALPVAILEIVPSASEVFGQTAASYRFALFGAQKKEFNYTVPAQTGGNGSVGLSQVYVCGFLGFMRFRIKTPLPQPASVGVIPDIPDIKSSNELFRNIADIVLTSDNEADEETSMLFSANTAPGYEHREYVQGDPLKRINWKLSSKRDKLMVRLDEAASSVQPSVVLDLYRKSGADLSKALPDEEKLLRSVFGLLTLLVKQGIACNFIYRDSRGETAEESVENPDQPAQLLLRVLAVKVLSDKHTELLRSDSAVACVIATTDAGADIAALRERSGSPDTITVIGTSPATPNTSGAKLWYLDDDNDLKLV